MTDEAMSPLRRRMIEDMTIRKFALKTNTPMCKESRSSLRSSDDHPTRQASRTYVAISCIWWQAVLACRPSIRLSTFKITLGRPEIVEHTHAIHDSGCSAHALDGRYANAHDDAKLGERGIWAGSFVEPWRFLRLRQAWRTTGRMSG